MEIKFQIENRDREVNIKMNHPDMDKRKKIWNNMREMIKGKNDK